MKKFILIAMCLSLVGCSAYVRSMMFDAAEATYTAANAYYQVNKGTFSLEDAARFEKYLLAYRLSLDTGKGVEGYAQRWYQFLQGY